MLIGIMQHVHAIAMKSSTIFENIIKTMYFVVVIIVIFVVVVVVVVVFGICIESIVSILDKKDNESIIDNIIFDINAIYNGFDGKILGVNIQCDDSRVTESMIKPINEAIEVLKSIVFLSLTNVVAVALEE